MLRSGSPHAALGALALSLATVLGCGAATSPGFPGDDGTSPDSGASGASGSGGHAGSGGLGGSGGRAGSGGRPTTGGRTGTGGLVEAGGSAGAGGCAQEFCPMPTCAPGFQIATPAGSCCPTCVPCNVACGPVPACPPGQTMVTPPGQCCPTGCDGSQCDSVRSQYLDFENQQLAGARACQTDADCVALNYGNACGSACNLAANGATVKSVISALDGYARKLGCDAACGSPGPTGCVSYPMTCLQGACTILVPLRD